MCVNNSKGFLGHQGLKNGRKGSNGKKDRPVCTYYGLTGHIADKCYKLHGYPPGYKPKGGNKAMENQVSSMQTSRNFGMEVLPLNVNSGFMPTRVLPNAGAQSSSALQNACIQLDIASQKHVGYSFGGSYVQAGPQVTLSQAQCEHFLNFWKNYMAFGLGNGAQTAHQVAFVMAPNPSIS